MNEMNSKSRRGENGGVNRLLLLEPVRGWGPRGGRVVLEGCYSLYFCRSQKVSVKKTPIIPSNPSPSPL